MRIGKYEISIVDMSVKAQCYREYLQKDRSPHEAVYAKYRELTGASVRESHKQCRVWLKKWGYTGSTKGWGI